VSENNQRAKFYKLTRAGRRQLQVEEENWERLAAAVFKVMQTT
jgi:DNA-binding MarR family transcriptional regulator